MSNKRYGTNGDEGHCANTGTPGRLGTRRVDRPLRWLGLAAAVLALAGMSGDRQAWGAVTWTVGQRAVMAAALKSTVPPELALAVAQAARGERLHGEGAPGAVGIMHVRPRLAREELGVKAYGLDETRTNAGVGVVLLERLNRRYEGRWDLTLSHYRGGPLFKCKEGPVVHDHTQSFVAAVMEWWERYKKDESVTTLREDVRSGRFPNGGISRRAEGGEWVRGREPGYDGWRRYGGRWRSTPEGGCHETTRGWGEFRSDNRPACESVRPRRFF